jgi:hypothetical protein
MFSPGNILFNKINYVPKLPVTIIIIFLSLIYSFPVKSQIFINEFLAKGNTTLEDPGEPGDYPDWIELYNAGNESVNLKGYY